MDEIVEDAGLTYEEVENLRKKLSVFKTEPGMH